MPRTQRPATRPGPRRRSRPPGGNTQALRLEALVDEIRLRLNRRAFVFDDPASYSAGVEESAAAIREAVEEFGSTLALGLADTAEKARRYSIVGRGDIVRAIEAF